MRLIHYSKEPLTAVYSRAHDRNGCGCYKTPGLWVSVEGPDDWVEWCRSESFGTFDHATEVTLAPGARILHLSTVEQVEAFDLEYAGGPAHFREIDWQAVRAKYQGIIIAPYQWSIRLGPNWYYGWDCASGVIWDAAAVVALRPIEPPDMTQKDEAA